jgi:hypothetical protein
MYIVSEELVYTFSIHFFVSHSNSNLKGKQLEWDESKQREKTPHEREGKRGETWRRRITVTSSLNTEGRNSP